MVYQCIDYKDTVKAKKKNFSDFTSNIDELRMVESRMDFHSMNSIIFEETKTTRISIKVHQMKQIECGIGGIKHET